MIANADNNKLSLAGDELIPHPKKIITHSISINAPAEKVWPWVVQLGAGRAGWYSYDRIDNGGRPSADKILPEFQQINVGDIFPAVPNSKDAFIVQQIHTGKAIVLVVPVATAAEEPDSKKRMNSILRVSWALVLENVDDTHVNLISRGRISDQWLKYSAVQNKKPIFIERIYGLFGKLPWFMTSPIAMIGHKFMESKMLNGIKRRAENEFNRH